MRAKSAALILGTLILVAVGIKWTTTSSQRQDKQSERKTIPIVARESKAHAKIHVEVPGPIIDYPTLSLDEMLRDYSVVIATPIAEKSYLVDDDTIATWYKFAILD